MKPLRIPIIDNIELILQEYEGHLVLTDSYYEIPPSITFITNPKDRTKVAKNMTAYIRAWVNKARLKKAVEGGEWYDYIKDLIYKLSLHVWACTPDSLSVRYKFLKDLLAQLDTTYSDLIKNGSCHCNGSGCYLKGETSYCFNIKTYPDIPDIIKEYYELDSAMVCTQENALEDAFWDKANDTVSEMREELNNRHKYWLDDMGQTGHSGGWLEVSFNYGDYENLPTAEEVRENFDMRTHEDDALYEDIKIIHQVYEHFVAIKMGLQDIKEYTQDVKDNFTSDMENVQYWIENIEANTEEGFSASILKLRAENILKEQGLACAV